MNQAAADAKCIFLNALDCQTPEELASFLETACQGDNQMHARVREQLDAHRAAGNFLHGGGSGETNAFEQIAERAGEQIGPYKLLQQIGEGGMGVVFMAEQERPVRRKIALKIIKPGMDTRQVIARFEAERQALAMMDHPNIAKVLDASTTDAPPLPLGEGQGEGALLQAPCRVPPGWLPAPTGRPYFVMELVQGVPITEYCDQCNLTTRERLELFVTVCQAVQHAHQKGIIHRDIKPTNVLVALQDGKAAPKIIDFGVAKAIGQQLTENTLTNAFTQMVGTPMYMSPEQAALSALGVDTRSDIYSLGAMLYELLTSTTPFEKDRLHAASYDELRRIIRDEDPPRPSMRMSTLAAVLATTVADRQRTEPRRLLQVLRGDLDWILMKCLDKDRNRRYETASALADDVLHYLNDEPVSASAPSRIYRLRKLVRRNKWPVIASAGVLSGLVATVIGLAVGLVSQWRQQAEAQLNLAASLHSRGRYAEAEALYRDGLKSASSDAAEDRRRAARTRLRLARVVYDQGDRVEAERLYREALAAYRAAFPRNDPNIAHALVTFALLLRSHHRFDEAESVFREAHEMYRRSTPANHHAIGESATHLANVLITLGRCEEAAPTRGKRQTNSRLSSRTTTWLWRSRDSSLGAHCWH